MPEFMQIVAALREQMSGNLSRSDVLRVLMWPISSIIILLVACIGAKADTWLVIALLILLILFFILYGGAFLFCLKQNPDALRSETYSLQKIAIEHGLLGDDLTGPMKRAKVSTAKASRAIDVEKDK